MNLSGRISVPERAAARALLVMLDGMAPSPCHEFSQTRKWPETMSPAVLRDVLMLAARYEAGDLPMVVSAGSADVHDPAIFKTLHRLDCEWVAHPPVAAKLGSKNTPTVAVLDAECGLLDSTLSLQIRSALVHVSPTTALSFARTLRKDLSTFHSVTLRAQHLDRYEHGDFLAYQRQLTALGEKILHVAAGGMCHCPNLSSNEVLSCGAGTSLLTAAPDGLLYPCPAFYHAGKSHALAAVRDLLDEPAWSVRIQELCYDLDCRACAFLSRTQNGRTDQACRFSDAESLARQQLRLHVVRSRRLWRSLCSLQASDSRQKTLLDCGNAYTAIPQPSDPTIDTFRQALVDIQTLAMQASVANASTPQSSDVIRQRWEPLAGVPSNTRQAVFRARVLEIVDDLSHLPVHAKNRALHDNGGSNRDKRGSELDGTDLLVSLQLPPDELEDIHRWHTLYMGWHHLVYSVRADKAAGFACPDISWMEAELALSRIPVDDWFDQARQLHGFHADDGWRCSIDFEKRSLHASRVGASPTVQGAQNSGECAANSEYWTEMTHLSEMSFWCIQTFHELRDALVDEFRSQYPDAESFNARKEQAHVLLHELGDAILAISAWFQEEVHAMGWAPTAEHAVNLDEKTLTLVRGKQSCAHSHGGHGNGKRCLK